MGTRRVAESEILKCLQDFGHDMEDWFVLDGSPCVRDRFGAFMLVLIEDDDLAAACTLYLQAHGVQMFSTHEEAEAVLKPPSFEQWNRMVDREFFESLELAGTGEMCASEGCKGERVAFGTYCREHHFRMVRGKPYVPPET